MLICQTCGEHKPSDEFYARDATGRRGGKCKSCVSSYQAKRYRSVGRERHLMSKFGITVEEFDVMLEMQDGACAICGVSSTSDERAFRVDHDHDTGRVRGLLCHSCNVAIGLMKDDVAVLASAIAYLDRARSASRV